MAEREKPTPRERELSIPTSKTMKLDEDCWELLIAAAQAKGVSPRGAAEGIIRTFSKEWAK